MSTFQPPLYNSDVYNPSLFTYSDESLSLYDADKRYLKITGGTISGALFTQDISATSLYTTGTADVASLKISGSLVDLSTISGVTAGTASAGKALIVDSNRDITNIRYLTASQLTGTLQTASQPNITAIGTLTTLSLNGSVNLNGNHNTTWNDNFIVTGSASSPTNTNGIGMAFTGITSTGRIKAYNYIMSSFNHIDINEGTIYCKNDKTVAIGHNSPSFRLDVSGDINASGNYRLAGSVANVGALVGVTSGQALASKAMILDASTNIINVNDITCHAIIGTNLTGTLQTASQPNITSLGTLTGLSSTGVISCTTNIRPLTMYKSDLASGSAISYVLGKSNATNQQGEITFTYSSTANQSTLSLGHFGNPQCLQVYSSGLVNVTNTTDASSSTTGGMTIAGGLGVAKKLYVGSTTDSTSVSTGALVIAGGLGVGLQISASKITSTGQCVCNQLNVGNYLSTVNGNQLNYLDILSAGSAQASKAVVLDANLDFGACRRFKTQKLMVGTDYTDTGRMITCLDSSVVAGDTRYLLTGGQANTANNSCELSYYHSANGSSNNEFRIGYNGGTLARFRFDGVIMNGGGTQLFNSSGQLVSAINTANDMSTTGNININNSGRLRHYTPLGAQFFNSDDNNITEGRIYCSGYNMYIGTQGDSAVRLMTNTSTRLYIGASSTGGGNCCFHGTSTSFPLSILKADGSSTLSYSYFNSSAGTGSGNNTGTTVSLYCSGRIMCNGEIDVVSDRRVKSCINKIPHDYVDKFIHGLTPKQFKYKQENCLTFGYIAQDVCKSGLKHFVQLHKMDGLEETIDDDGFVSPKDLEFSINTGYFIPLLHMKVKQQDDEIKELKEVNKDLQIEISELKIQNTELCSEIDNINRRLDMMMINKDEPSNIYDNADEFYLYHG